MTDVLQQALYGLTTGSIYALVALGFSLVFQTTALLSFAHPQLMMLGGMVGYTILARFNAPFVLAAAGAALFSGLISVLIDLAILRPMRWRRATENNLVVVTIGVGIILMSLAMLVWGPYSLPYPNADKPVSFAAAGLIFEQKSIAIWIAVVATLLVFQIFLRRSRLGLAMRAGAVDSATAELVGIPIRWVIALSFALSGALAGLAGALIGSLYYASFDMGATGLKSLCAAVIGGFGNLPGAVLGGLLLGVFESFMTTHVAAQLTDTFIYGLLILLLLVRPQGLLGAVQRKV
jgi:branched-chain amino acid transport system permease protein